jgi:uncharacterized membrane protein YvbJ
MKKVLLLIVPLVLSLAWYMDVAQAQSAPNTVFERYVQAVNAGDMGDVRNLISDDVARSDFVGCRIEMSNKDCLVFYIATTVVNEHGRITVVRSEQHGDEVHAELILSSDAIRRAGVERTIGTDVVRVRTGRIVSFHFVPNFTDSQTATFFATLGIGPFANKH